MRRLDRARSEHGWKAIGSQGAVGSYVWMEVRRVFASLFCGVDMVLGWMAGWMAGKRLTFRSGLRQCWR